MNQINSFNLQIVEIEILRAIHYYQLSEIGTIYENIVPRYCSKKLSKSQFYRIIEKLEKGSFISSERMGKSKIITLEQRGHEELALFVKYIFGFLRDQISINDMLQDIIRITTKEFGCLRRYQMLNIGPYPINLSMLQILCKNCEKPYSIDDEDLAKPIFILLPNSDKSLFGMEGSIQIIETPNPFDLLPKDKSIDFIIENLTLYRYRNDLDKFLAELDRLLDDNGFIFFFEPTENDSQMVIQIMNQMLVSQSNKSSDWMIKQSRENLMSIKDIKTKINEYFLCTEVRSEMAMTLFIAKKRQNIS